MSFSSLCLVCLFSLNIVLSINNVIVNNTKNILKVKNNNINIDNRNKTIKNISKINLTTVNDTNWEYDEPSIYLYPFLISLQYDSGNGSKHICSGTILSNLWILTAAHCVCYTYTAKAIKAEKLSIIAGAPDLQEETIAELNRTTVTEIHSHPEYNFDSLIHDIALLKLSSKLVYSESVRPVKLGDGDFVDDNSTQTDDYCVAVGWNEDNIHELNIKSVFSPDKEELINDLLIRPSHYYTLLNDTDDYLCQEESGGPLLCDNEQVGVATFRLGCSYKNDPNVWTRVYDYKYWISNVTRLKLYPEESKNKNRLARARGRPGSFGRPSSWRPSRPSWRPSRPSWRPSRPGRPGGSWRPSRPGGSWRPSRPSWRPGSGIRGRRPGGRYAQVRVNIYRNRGTYIRPYGSYGYYGMRPFFYPGHPLFIWYGSPLLFYYRPWFLMDLYLTHLYIHSAIYQYHAMYGYGYYVPYARSSPYTRRNAIDQSPIYVATFCSTVDSPLASDTKEGFMYKKCNGPPAFYNATARELCPKYNLFCK